MRYLVEPTAVTELRGGGIIYSPYNTFRVKKVDRVTDSHVIVYYAPRFEKTTASSMCPNNEKFTRINIFDATGEVEIECEEND